MRIFFLLCITIFSAANIFGQIFSSSVPNDGKYKNKTFTVYDPPTNLTTVHSPFLLLYRNEGSLGHLGEFLTGSVSFGYPGKTQVSTPDFFELKIISHGNNSWKFIRTEARDLG